MMKAGWASDTGRRREENEDAFCCDRERGLFIVADGLGGRRGGAAASWLAVETVHGYIKDRLRGQAEARAREKENTHRLLVEAVLAAGEKIERAGERRQELRGMGTTVVVVFTRDAEPCVVHVGDSRAYLIGDNRIKEVTEDHSLVAQLVQKGELTPQEAKNHRLSHILSQALGATRRPVPGVRRFRWEKGDHILLCTDGLTNMLNDTELCSLVLRHEGDPAAGCQSLVEEANKRGGLDNITVVLLYNDGRP